MAPMRSIGTQCISIKWKHCKQSRRRQDRCDARLLDAAWRAACRPAATGTPSMRSSSWRAADGCRPAAATPSMHPLAASRGRDMHSSSRRRHLHASRGRLSSSCRAADECSPAYVTQDAQDLADASQDTDARATSFSMLLFGRRRRPLRQRRGARRAGGRHGTGKTTRTCCRSLLQR